MAGLSEFRNQYPQYADVPDAELADSLHAKFYSDIPKDQYLESLGMGKPSLMSRAGAALKPAEREPMPSTADTINAGWTSPPEETLSVPGSVMDGYTPRENGQGMPIEAGMGPMRKDYYDQTRAGLLSAPVEKHAAAAKAGGQVGKIAAESLPARVVANERAAAGDTQARTMQELGDQTNASLTAQPLRTEAAKEANRQWLTENSAGAIEGIKHFTKLDQADAEAELQQMIRYGVKPSWVDSSMPDATLMQAASANIGATGPALQKALLGLSEAAADQPMLQLPWMDYAKRTPRQLEMTVTNLDKQIRAARNVGGKIEAGSWNDVVSTMGPSLATNMPPLIAAALVAAKNPAAGMAIANGGLGVMGMQKFGDNYLKGQMKGLSAADNLTQASLGAAAEVIPEKLSLNSLFAAFKTLGKGSAIDAVKAFAKQQLTEHSTEQITTIADHLIDKAYTEPNKSIESLWSEMKQTAMATAIQAPLLAAGGAAAHITGQAVVGAKQRFDEGRDITAGMQFDPGQIDAAARQSLDPANAQMRQVGTRAAPVPPPASPRAELDAILSSDKPVAEILAAQAPAAPQATPQAPLQPAALGWPDIKTPAVATLPDGQIITGQIAGIQDSDGQPMARFVGADGQVWMIQPGEADIKPAPAAAKRQRKSAFVSSQQFSVDTEDNGKFDVTVHRTASGDVVVNHPDGLMEYKAAFANGKTDAELLAYGFEPVGFRNAAQAPAGDGTRTAPVQAETAEHVKIAEQAVNTEPTEGQKQAGNYQLGHLVIQGLDIAIENPAGSVRSGVGKDGKPWSNTLNHTYGFLKGATAADGDKLDVFIGPDPQSQQVFVIDQIDPDTGRYDEAKTMLGFSSEQEAHAAYLSNYDAGWKGVGAITPLSMPAFKAWIAKGATHKPLAYDQKAAIAERNAAADTQKAGEAYAAEREKAVAAIGEDQVAAIEDQVADQNAGQPTSELYRAIATALKAEASRQATQPAAPAQTPAAPSSMAQPEPVAAAPTPKQLEMKARAAKNIDAYLNQNAAGRWQLSQPIDDADLRSRVIDEMDRRNQGEVNAQDQAVQSQSAVQDLPQAAPEAGALSSELTAGGEKSFSFMLANKAMRSYHELNTPEAKQDFKRGYVLGYAGADVPAEQIIKSRAMDAGYSLGSRIGEQDRTGRGTNESGKAIEVASTVAPTQDKAAPATEERAYTKGQAEVLARRMTNQGLPSEAYPHPTEAGMWAIGVPGEEQPADVRDSQTANDQSPDVDFEAMFDEVLAEETLAAPATVSLPQAVSAAISGQMGKQKRRMMRLNTEAKADNLNLEGKLEAQTKAKAAEASLTAMRTNVFAAEDAAAKAIAEKDLSAFAEFEMLFPDAHAEIAKQLGVSAAPPTPKQKEMKARAKKPVTPQVSAPAWAPPTLAEALNELAEMKSRASGPVVDARLLDRIKQQEALVKELEAEADPKVGAGETATKERFEYPNPKYTSPSDLPAMRAVVDYMNGDITRDAMTQIIVDSGLPEGTIRSITNRLGEDSYSNGEIADIKRRQAAAKEASPAPTIAKSTKSAVVNTAKGLDDAINGLGKLFGGTPGTLGMGPVFNEDTYAQAKPLFASAVAHFKDAGQDLKEVMRAVIRMVQERFGAGVTANMRPYIIRFMEDVKAGNVVYDGSKENVGNATSSTDTETAGSLPGIPEEGLSPDEGGRKPGKVPRNKGAVSDRPNGNADGTGDLFGPGTGDSAGGPVPAGTNAKPGADGIRGDVSPAQGVKPDSLQPERRVGDYVITDVTRLGEGGAKTKFRNNVAAIRLIAELDETARPVTSEDQDVLARYVGWGMLPQAFDPANQDWSKEHAELKGLLNQEEWDAAFMSTRYAHYTSEEIITNGVYAALERFGFSGGRILEPGSGVGNFVGLMPASMRTAGSRVTGIEREWISAKIGQYLYPTHNMLHADFTEFQALDGYFDAAIGNPPFAATPLTDASGRKHLSGLSIHNYFFAKSIDMLRENGVFAMVVSNSFLDAARDNARRYIGERTRFLGAIRLPNNAFKKNAGTEVTTDIIFLQKLPDADVNSKATKEAAKSWMDLETIPDPLGGEAIPINAYFKAHPEMMLGRMERSGTMYRGGMSALVAKEGANITEQLREAIARLPQNVYVAPALAATKKAQDRLRVALEDDTVQPGGYYTKDGRLYIRLRDEAGEKLAEEITPQSAWTEKTLVGEGRFARLVAVADLRRTVRQLLAAEIRDDAAEMKRLRKQLNTQYDAIVKEWDFLSAKGTIQLIGDDPDYPLLAALETDYNKGIDAKTAKAHGVEAVKPSAKKMPIFTQRVIPVHVEVTKADTPVDALMISIYERGHIDQSYISALLGGRDAQGIIDELVEQEHLFLDPELNHHVLKDEYLSGNVRRKLKIAQAAGMNKNARALERVIPEDVPSHNIIGKMGANWISNETYQEFINEQLGDGTTSRIKYQATAGSFIVEIKAGSDVANTNTLGIKTEGGRATDLIEKILNKKQIKLGHYDDKGKFHLDKEATDNATDKATEIKTRFADWLFRDAERSAFLTRAYNDAVNNYVVRKYDGALLSFPGKVPDSIIKFRRHQRNAIARILQSGQALLDHVVGAGKTFTIVAAAMEMRRTGLAHKPMVVVPNHLVKQWASDFYRLYPGAKVLAATKNDFQRENRRAFMAKIATGDWDAVIIAHSSFGFIRPDPAFEAEFNGVQIQEITDAINELGGEVGKKDARDKGTKRTVKQLAAMREKLQERIKALRQKPMDNLLDLAELGVDALFVDEAHAFKNLMFTTKMQGVRVGGDPSGSQRAYDMYLKTHQIMKKNGGRGVVFATGTPISNTMAEMYHVLRYLAPETLTDMGLKTFDAWADSFASAETFWMQSMSGEGYKSSTRLEKFVNVPSLLKVYDQVADTVTMDDIKDAYREENDGKEFPIPAIKGGKSRTPVSIKRSDAQTAYMADVAKRAKALEQRKGPPKKGEDNMLSIMGDARKAAMDIRLVDHSTIERDPEGRIAIAAGNIWERYQQFDAVKGTQLVFSDMGTPKKTATKELKEYQELKDRADKLDDQALQDRATLGDAEAQAALDDAEDAVAAIDAKGKDWLDAIKAAMRGFSIYDDLKQALIEKGIPDYEIAFIHDYNTDDQKAALFKAVNSGKIRVVMGSTPKMGAGTNVQERLVALHHLDIPWRPSDVEQREGRIVRQGNKLLPVPGEPRTIDHIDGFEVEILAYATQDTLDLYMWQTQENKLKMIGQLRTGNVDIEMDNAFEEMEFSAGEMQAAATSNPYLLDEIRIKDRIKKLERQKRSHEGQANDIINRGKQARKEVGFLPAEIKRNETLASGNDKYLALIRETDAAMSATVQGKEVAGREAIMTTLNEALDAMRTSVSVEINGTTLKASSKAQFLDMLGEIQNKAEEDIKTVTIAGEKAKVGAFGVEAAKAFEDALDKTAHEKIKVVGFEFAGKTYKSYSALAEAVRAFTGDRDRIIFTIAGKDYTQRSKIDAAIRPALERAIDGESRELIGEFAGTKVYVEAVPDRKDAEKVILNVQVEHDGASANKDVTPSGTWESQVEPDQAKNMGPQIVAMARRLMDNARSDADYSISRMEKAKRTLADVESRGASAEWDGEADLKEARKKYEEILKKLAGKDKELKASATIKHERMPPRGMFESLEDDQRSAVTRAIDRAIAIEQGKDVKPLQVIRVRNRIGKLRADLEAGKISEALFISQVESLHAQMEIAAESRRYEPTNGRARGADFLRQKLLEAKRRGDISEQAADMAEWFILKNPALVDDLGIGIRTPSENQKASGNYNPLNRVMTLFKESASDTTAVHEILHHLERMMPAEMQAEIRKEWLRAVTSELQKATKANDQKRIAYFEAVLVGNMARATKLLTGEMGWFSDLAIGQDYQYLNPSEFWAVRMTSTMAARFEAKSIWARSLQWLREALEHIKGALGLKSDHPLLKALDDLIARGTGEFVSKEMLGSSEVYASIEESGPEEVAGVVMRDVSLAARLLLHPRQIAANHKPFVPVFDTAIKQFEERDRIVSGLGEMAKPYFELTHAQRLNVNKIVEQGRLDRTVYTVADLENGIHHAESGDLVTLDAEEIGAYKALRRTFNEALSLFRDTMLEEFGFAELIPEAKAAAKLRQMIADGEIEESRIEWARHVAKAIDEIEQAKRTGYAPFNRYGQFVVAVKALPAGVEVQDDDGKQFVTGIPESGDDPLTQIVTDMGGQYDVFRDGWVIDDTRKAVLRALETTLFATKVEVNAFNEWRKQGKDVTAIPEVKAAFDEAKLKYGKAPNARVLAFHITEKAKADDANLSTFDELARISDVDVETWDAVREKLQEAIKAKSFRKHFFGSDNTPGYSVDFERSVADYIIGMSGYLARRKHVKDFDNAIKHIKAPALAKYAEDYRKYVNSPADEFALLKNIGFLYYIAGSTATAVANLTQVPMLTMPTLVQFVPHHIAAREVARAWGEALAMFSPTKTGLQMFDPAKVPADVRDVFKTAWEDQLFVPLETLDLMAASSIKTVGGRKTMRALSVTTQAIAYEFMFAERLNRITTFIAAQRISRMKVAKDRMRDVVKNDAWARHSIGGRAWGERNFAEWVVDESQYRMGKVNRSTWMRGVGSPLLQFKGYMIQTLEAGYRMAVMHGKGGKPAALAALAMMLMLGGLWGLPGLEDLRDIIERLYKLNTGKDLDLKTEVRQLIARKMGSAAIAAAANKGIPYATVGVDMSRVGMGNILPDSALQVGGIPADLAIGRPWRASEKMMAGKPVEAMSEFLPNFLKNPATGLQWKFDGLRDKYGSRMMTPGEFDYGDVAIKSLGWTPTKVTNRREYTYAESRAERGIDELKRRYTNDLVRAYVHEAEAKDPAEKAEYKADQVKILARIEEHNKTASPENLIKLDPGTLRRKAAAEFSGSAAREGKERKLSRGEAVKRRELFQLR